MTYEFEITKYGIEKGKGTTNIMVYTNHFNNGANTQIKKTFFFK